MGTHQLDNFEMFKYDWDSKIRLKFFNRWEYQITLPVPWETCLWVKKQQLEHYMELLTGSKLENRYSKLYIVTLFNFNS